MGSLSHPLAKTHPEPAQDPERRLFALGREAAASASLYPFLNRRMDVLNQTVRMGSMRRRTSVGESGRHGDVVPTIDPRTVTQHRPYPMQGITIPSVDYSRMTV